MASLTKNTNQAKFTNEDIKLFAQAFDVLLEGAIQTRQISRNGKLAVHNKKGDDND